MNKQEAEDLKNKIVKILLAGFNPNQDRAKDGKWTDGDGAVNKESKKKVSEELQSEFKDLTIDIYQSEKTKTLTLSRVIVPENSRESGIGTKFMNSLIQKADKLGYKIILTPSEDFGGNKNRLIEFYKRFGFINNKGSNRDFSHREDMYRLPKSTR